jgi:hypothetical protein
VFSRPFAAPLELYLGAIDGGGVCTSGLQATFGSNQTGSQVVGLIDSVHALVNPTKTGSTATIQIVRAADSTFSRTPVDVNMGTSITPVSFVVGVEATTHFALLVTNDVPALISF